jgi:5-methylcytosine-specific restriction endonuclease McrA
MVAVDYSSVAYSVAVCYIIWVDRAADHMADPRAAEYSRRYRERKAGRMPPPTLPKCLTCGKEHRGARGEYCSRCWLKTDEGREWQRNRVKDFRVSNPESTARNTFENNRKRGAFRRAGRRNALVPLTRHQLQHRFSLFGNCCAYCGNSGKISIDHVMPLSKGGLDEHSNIVPACKTCNSSKNAKDVKDWYLAQPFFSHARWAKLQRHCGERICGQLALAIASP